MVTNYRQISRAVILQNNKVLLAKAKNKVNYFLPGGEIKKFESASNALVREIREELDITSEIIRFLGVIENFETNYLFSLRLNASANSNPTSKEDGLIFEWKSVKEIKFLTIYPISIKGIIKSLATKDSFETIWMSNF